MAHASSELYGSDRVFLESVIAMVEAGWEVVVTLPQPGPLVDAVEKAGAMVGFCPTPVLRKAALRPAGLIRLLAETVKGIAPAWRLLRNHYPDLVYVNTVTVPLWLPLARLANAKVIAHVHEAEDAVPWPIRYALTRPLRFANIVVVNSLATVKALTAAQPRLAGKMTLTYNGVPGPAEAEVKQEPAKPLRILLVGRVSPRKGTDVAVEAMTLLRRAGTRANLDILGSVFPGYEWFEKRVLELIDTGLLRDSVHLNGFHSDVWEAYRNADIAIVPSLVEPFGNTSVEAQLAGVPVIVSDAQGLPETVDNGRFGTVVPAGDPAALAAAIESLVEDWPATRERAELAQQDAGVRFAVERYREEIAGIADVLVVQ
jgi:glycosyltransferase involved in cell wall biosynthesis